MKTFCFFLFSIFFFTSLFCVNSYAAIFEVTKTVDTVDGSCDASDCSLREAVIAANQSPGRDTIKFRNGDTYVLSRAGEGGAEVGDLNITDDLDIDGTVPTSFVRIDANSIDRVFYVEAGKDVKMNTLGILNGSKPGGDGGAIKSAGNLTLQNFPIMNCNAYHGGAVYNEGDLTLQSVFFTQNKSTGSGGSIYNKTVLNRARATIKLKKGIIAQNEASDSMDGKDAGYGGGIYNQGGDVQLKDVTLNKNKVIGGDGGGVASLDYYLNGVYMKATLIIEESLIINNESDLGGGVMIGNINKNIGELTILKSTIQGNKAAQGGGMMLMSGKKAFISESTITGNTASEGGGISNFTDLVIENSTISENSARRDGGGIQNGASNFLHLNNVTIAYNTADADNDGDGRGGGVRSGGEEGISGLLIKNTLIGKNSDLSGRAPDCWEKVTSEPYNLIENPTGCNIIGAPANTITGVDPQLLPLANNGGPTLTYAIKGISPALNRGDNATCKPTDQRGVTRPQFSICDIGAFEREKSPSLPD